ncbi:MAG TPA: hypothetical protein VHJ79_12520 [Mycobacterium sp.]|nr:hypothetical protein [Mycobacterium sp.]
MRRLAVAAVLMLVAACGSEQPVAETSPSTPTTEPIPSTRNIITEGLHDKRVGQPGGFGCGEGPDAVCDVTFTVTAIEQNPPCPGGILPAGKRLLRIEVDAQAPLEYQYEPPPTALMLSHWALETADGAMHYDLQMVDACSPRPGVFAGPLAPATHPRDSVVVIAPSQVTFLWLGYEKTAYRWPVRPPI